MSNSKLIFDAVHDYNASIDPKPKQIEAFEYFLAGKDVIVNLPVGYGKSLIYHVLPKLVQRATPDLEKPVVLTISPLNIIQTEQIDILKRHNISACSLPYLDNEESLDSDLNQFNHSIVNGDFAVVFSHPEALLNTSKGQELLTSCSFIHRVAALVIDECHIVETWGEEFRTAFKKLKTLPAVFENKPILALSGTLTVGQLKKLPEILGMKNPAIVQESPDRQNIFLQKVEKVKGQDICEIYEEVFKKECDNLKQSPMSYPVTLLFMPLFYISQAAAYLQHIFGKADITNSYYAVLYSRQDKAVIQATVTDLQSDNPRIRLVLTSSVAGMGFDPPCVTRVIHAKPPRTLSQYLQEIGRAGRRGQKATATLYYNNRDIAKNIPGIEDDILQYCKTDDKCLREILLGNFGFSKTQISNEECCSYCATKELDIAGLFDDTL